MSTAPDRLPPTSFEATEPAAASGASTPWIADLGDGQYQNPVLFADYSDPDAVRVGTDFWMTASSFNHVPGLPILHSRDLVNWTLVNHALPFLVPREHFTTPRHGGGVWAPSIRYHAGRYWIFYPDPDFGIYLITADDPRHAWAEPHLVLAGRGLIDPCPLWDDDGRCYLVHGWARSRSGISNVVTLRELTPDGQSPIDEGRVIIDGNTLSGWHTIEGPKIYHRDGWFWVFAPAGGVAKGYQAVFRSRSITGPYEHRIVLAQGRTTVNGPHQGAWVDTGFGEDWFLHFQEMPAYGRVVHLQPMRWRSDGWPEMGTAVDTNGLGEPVLRHAKPALPPQPIAHPPTSDRFADSRLGLQWQWQGNPASDWAQVDAPARALRLRCIPLQRDDSHWSAAHLLLQKFVGTAFTITTSMTLVAQDVGDRCGLIVFGHDYAWIGLRAYVGNVAVVLAECRNAEGGAGETVLASHLLAARADEAASLYLRVEVDTQARATFSWSEDAITYHALPFTFAARSSRWVGAKVGVFASAAPNSEHPGFAEVRNFSMTAPECATPARN